MKGVAGSEGLNPPIGAAKKNVMANPQHDAGKVSLVTIRNLEVARRFPQELPEGPRLQQGKTYSCETCSSPLKPVIITTGGPYADPAIWRAYPLAIDGFQCDTCQSLSYPVFMTPQEMTELLHSAVAMAQAGAFDEAEFSLRRAAMSWPTYMPVRMNFGAMLLDRIRAEQAGEKRQELIHAYLEEAEAQLRKAIAGEPPAPPAAYFMLGKLLVRSGKADGASVLQQFLSMPEAPPALRAEARALLDGR